MNPDRRLIKLADAVDAILTGPFGSLLHKSDYADEGIPLVNPANISGNRIASDGIKRVGFDKARQLSGYYLRAGDIVIGRRGELGRCAVVGDDEAGWLCGTGSFIVRPGENFDPHFLAMMIRSPFCVEQLEKAASGATMPNISNGSLGRLRIAMPPMAEQRRIVAILNKAFGGIANATENAEKNLANARDLLISQMDRIFTADEHASAMIGDIADAKLGKMLDKRKNRGEPRVYLRNLNVRWYAFDLSDLLEMPFESDEVERYSVRKGDALICEGGYPGRSAVWMSDESIFFQKALHRVRFKDPRMAEWLVHYLYWADATGSLRPHFTGSGIQHFTGKALKSLKIPIPDGNVIGELVARLNAARDRTEALEGIYSAKLTALEKLEAALLAKAFSGELIKIDQAVEA